MIRTSLLAAIAGGASVNYPTPANINAIVIGDSRVSLNGENSNLLEAQRIGARGYAGWMLNALNHRVRLVGNFGINGNTIQDVTTRESAQGTATGSSPTWRAEYLTQQPGMSAGICIMLVGVNNTTSAIATTGPLYDTLFMDIINAGMVLVILNENPNSDQSGQGAVNYIRRQYLDTWPASSVGMSAGQKITYGAKVLNVNVYDVLALSAGSYYPKANYYPSGDLLHVGPVGARAMGEAVAAAIEPMMVKAGFAVRNTLPAATADSILPNCLLTGTTAITATNGESGGASGNNLDGNSGTCVTGAVPTGWSIARSSTLRTLLNGTQGAGSQLTCTVSQGTDSNGYSTVRFRITGQVGTTASTYGIVFSRSGFFTSASIGSNTNGAGSGGVSASDILSTICRLNLAAAPLGLLGTAVESFASSANFPGSTRANLSGTILTSGAQWDAMAAYDKTVMSQPFPTAAGFVADTGTLTLQQSITITILGGVPIDIDLSISRFAMVKNR